MALDGGVELGVVHGVWRSGKRMVMAEDAELPDRCVKTDRPADGEWADIRLQWHHPALYLVLLVNLIVYFIVAYFVSTRVIVHVGITLPVLASARRARRLTWALLLAGLALCVVAATASLRSCSGRGARSWCCPSPSSSCAAGSSGLRVSSTATSGSPVYTPVTWQD